MLRKVVVRHAVAGNIAGTAVAIHVQVNNDVVVARRNIVERVSIGPVVAVGLADAFEQLVITRAGGAVIIPRVVGLIIQRHRRGDAVGIIQHAGEAGEICVRALVDVVPVELRNKTGSGARRVRRATRRAVSTAGKAHADL